SGGLRGGGAIELEPEAVLPSQYFSLPAVDASLQAEKRLMLAVLEDAVGTFQKYVNARERTGQRLFAEVEDWFAADEVEWPYSFLNISQALGLDPEYLRSGLGRWEDLARRRTSTASNVVRVPCREGIRSHDPGSRRRCQAQRLAFTVFVLPAILRSPSPRA